MTMMSFFIHWRPFCLVSVLSYASLFFSKLCVCVVCVCTCVCRHTATTHRGQRSMFAFLCHSCSHQTRSFTKSGGHWFLVRLVTSKPQCSFCLHIPQHWDHRHMWPCLVFYMGPGDLNLDSHVCTASALTTDHLSNSSYAPFDLQHRLGTLWSVLSGWTSNLPFFVLGSWTLILSLLRNFLMSYLTVIFANSSPMPFLGISLAWLGSPQKCHTFKNFQTANQSAFVCCL